MSAVSVLSDRITALEENVFGELDKNSHYVKATDVMLDFNSQFMSAVRNYERVVMVMKRMDELERYLDPLYYHQLSTGPVELAAELVAVKPQLHQLAEQLKTIEQLLPFLDSQHIKDASGMKERVERARRRHQLQSRRQLQLAAQLSQFKQLFSQLVENINHAVIDLSERTQQLSHK